MLCYKTVRQTQINNNRNAVQRENVLHKMSELYFLTETQKIKLLPNKSNVTIMDKVINRVNDYNGTKTNALVPNVGVKT